MAATLAGYPAEDLYPLVDLYPGLPSVTYVFRTPEQDWVFPMEGNLHAYLPHAKSVWRIAGTWYEGYAPSAAEIEASDRFYHGGYLHEVDENDVEELIAAGYGSRIEEVEVPT